MSKYTIISLLLSTLWFVLGYKTFRYDRKNKPYVLFGSICLTMMIWTLFLGISYSLDNLNRIILLLKIAYIGAFLFSPITLHFYAEIGGIRLKPLTLAANYLPSVALVISNFVDFFVFHRYERRDGEWFGILDAASPWMKFYLLVVIATFAAAFAILLRWHLRTKINKEKIQSKLLLVIFTSTYFSSLILTMVLPFFGISDYQHFGIILFALYILGLNFLISRFRFLNLHRGFPADEIIANLGELVFILDRDFRILDLNRAVEAFFPSANGSLRGRPFKEIVAADKEVAAGLSSLAGGKKRSFSALAHFAAESGPVPAKVSISEMKDRFGDHSGYFAIASQVKGIEDFKKSYGLTKREIEIVGLTVSGTTYRGTAKELQISEKTVERHIANIYNKIGISSKIDLLRIAGDYGFKI